MSDIGWCNHISVTHGVCGLCGQYVGSSEQDAARDNEIAALRERAEKAEAGLAELTKLYQEQASRPSKELLDATIKELEEKALFFEHESDEWHGNWLKMQERVEKAETDLDAAIEALLAQRKEAKR